MTRKVIDSNRKCHQEQQALTYRRIKVIKNNKECDTGQERSSTTTRNVTQDKKGHRDQQGMWHRTRKIIEIIQGMSHRTRKVIEINKECHTGQERSSRSTRNVTQDKKGHRDQQGMWHRTRKVIENNKECDTGQER